MTNVFKQMSTEDLAARSHLILRILCLIIVEYACAQLVEQSTGTPAVAGNYVLASLYVLALALSFINKRVGYAIGMAAGIINVIVKVVIVVGGHEHFPYYPFVWIPQSIMVFFFCFLAFRRYGKTQLVEG